MGTYVVILCLFMSLGFGDEQYYYAKQDNAGLKGSNKTFTLAFLSAFALGSASFPGTRGALRIGLQTVQERGLLPGFGIRYMFGHSKCNEKIAVQKTVDIWKKSGGLSGIIGAGCSVACQPVSLLAAAWATTAISYGCASTTLSNKKIYPTFARTAGTYSSYVSAMDGMIKLFNWDRIGILCDVNDLHRTTGQALKALLEARGVKVFYYAIASTETNRIVIDKNMEKQKSIIKQLKKVSRIICIFMYEEDIRAALINMYEEGMHDQEHVFMGLEVHPGYISDPVYKPQYGLEIWQGWILIAPADIRGQRWTQFRHDVVNALKEPDLKDVAAIHPDMTIEKVDTYAGKRDIFIYQIVITCIHRVKLEQTAAVLTMHTLFSLLLFE
jgi:hypothetical protein